jgi:hypothetical protein
VLGKVGETGDLRLEQRQPFVLDEERGAVLRRQCACQSRLAGAAFPQMKCSVAILDA